MSDFDMQNMTREELLARYEAGERDFRGVVLQYISLDGIEFVGADFTGAIFNRVSFQRIYINRDIGNSWSRFTNCNLSCSEWWYCRIPRLVSCYMQYAVIEGCYLRSGFVDCDWRNGQVISSYFDGFIFDRCDLRNTRWSSGNNFVGGEFAGLDPTGILYSETFDKEGVFHPSIYDDLPF